MARFGSANMGQIVTKNPGCSIFSANGCKSKAKLELSDKQCTEFAEFTRILEERRKEKNGRTSSCSVVPRSRGGRPARREYSTVLLTVQYGGIVFRNLSAFRIQYSYVVAV